MSKNTVRKKITGRQLMPGIFISLAISFLLFLYAPVDLYCANVSEFWFDFSTLLITALGMFAACFAVLAVLYLIAMLIHPYVYRIALAGGLALFICTYIQGNFMIDKLPPLDGTSIWWEKYDILRKDTLILWGIVLAVVVLAAIFLRKERFENAAMFISGCMTLMLLVTACSTALTNGALIPKVHLHISEENEFNMSSDENFVIFVLDTADSREFTSLLEDHPEYRDIFADFTYFENMMGNYSCTMNAVAYILSGEWFENQEPLADYLNDVYMNSPLWEELWSRGYQIDLYEDDIRAQDDSVADNFGNVYHTTVRPNSYLELAKEADRQLEEINNKIDEQEKYLNSIINSDTASDVSKAKASQQLSGKTIAGSIEEYKDNALEAIDNKELAVVNSNISAIEEVMDFSPETAKNALKEIYQKLTAELYLSDNLDQNEKDTVKSTLNNIEEIIVNNSDLFSGNDLNEDKISGIIKEQYGDIFAQLSEREQAEIVVAISQYADYINSAQIQQIAASYAGYMYNYNNSYVYETIKDGVVHYVALENLALVKGYRYIYIDSLKEATLQNGYNFYKFHLFNNSVQRQDGAKEEMDGVSKLKNTLQIPEDYAIKEFGCYCEYIKGSSYAIIYTNDIYNASDALVDKFLNK